MSSVAKIIYSEKLGKKLDIRLFENEDKSLALTSSTAITTTVFTDRKPEEIGNKQSHALFLSSEKIFEKTYYVNDDENKFVNTLEKVIADCEKKVSIDIAAVEKFNNIEIEDEDHVDKFCNMLVDFKNRIEELESGKVDKVSGEEALKTIIAGLKRMGTNLN